MTDPIRGLVVDIDDTLYLERSYVRSGFEHIDSWAANEFGVEGVGRRAWELFESGRRRTTITDALVDCGVRLTTAAAEAAVEAYRSHSPNITLLPDAVAFLDAAVERLPIAIVTDGPAQSQWAKVRALGLERIADPVVVTADLGLSKPDPEVFLAAVRGWNMLPSTLAYVADNPAKDFSAPLALGWRAVRVRRAGSLHSIVPTPQGVLEVGDLGVESLGAMWSARGQR